MSNCEILYVESLVDVNWSEMKATLAEDRFDNGRTPEQLRCSFEHSFATVVAYADGRIIGTARALSDGVCNAHVVDVWTFTPFRHRGVATHMMQLLEAKLHGQHVSLFSSDAVPFYTSVGYSEEIGGLSKVIGRWLNR